MKFFSGNKLQLYQTCPHQPMKETYIWLGEMPVETLTTSHNPILRYN